MRLIAQACLLLLISRGSDAGDIVSRFRGRYLSYDDGCSLSLKRGGRYSFICESGAQTRGKAVELGQSLRIMMPTSELIAPAPYILPPMVPAGSAPWPPSLSDPTRPLVASIAIAPPRPSLVV